MAGLVTSAQAAAPPPGETLVSRLPLSAVRPPGPALHAPGLAGCEQRLLRTGDRGVPNVLIVGASFTAGVGPGRAAGSWAVLLARRLHWNAVVSGASGVGYVHPGIGRKGPVSAELARAGLRDLRPALVIVQAGHDDMAVPPGVERHRVEQTVAMIRAQAPRARIALLTVFAGRARLPAAYRTDRAIVAGGTAADPHVIVMDPLMSGWRFPRTRDGLHPSATGSAWIAGEVAQILLEHGVRPAPDRPGPVICDYGLSPVTGPARRPAPSSPAPRPGLGLPGPRGRAAGAG